MSLEEVIRRTVADAVADALAQHRAPIQRETYKVREAAEALGVSEQQVRRLIDAGEITARRAGPNGHLMVSVESLRAWARGESPTNPHAPREAA